MQINEGVFLKFESAMKASSLRVTKVRRRIFIVLFNADNPLSMQEIVNCSQVGHFVSVYRSIDAMLKAGLVKQVPQGFKNQYELSDLFNPHHHHITCEHCGETAEVHDERIESVMHELTIAAGLRPTKHHFEMYGICQDCLAHQQV